jgi:hypothetical protein
MDKQNEPEFEEIDIEHIETDSIIEQSTVPELELVTIRQRPSKSPIKWSSISPSKIIRSLIHSNKFSTDNLTTVQTVNVKSEDEEDEEDKDDKKKSNCNDTLKYIMILINHILIQLSLLSILEPLLYFNFILRMEEEMFYEQLDVLTENTQEIISYDDAQSFRGQIFYDPLIDFIVYEHQSIDSTYNTLQYSAETAGEEASEILSSLKNKSFEMALMINIIALVYTLGIKYVYKESILNMLIHHVTLIVFIGIYEIWFFTNIASKYFPWSSEEILFHLFQCFWIDFTNKFPEMHRLENNVTFSCEV